MRKSSDEVRINPRKNSENQQETVYSVKFEMDETHSISQEQREKILEVLLTGSKKEDKQEEEQVSEKLFTPSNNEEGFQTVIILAAGIFLGFSLFFLLSMI